MESTPKCLERDEGFLGGFSEYDLLNLNKKVGLAILSISTSTAVWKNEIRNF